MDPPPEPLLAFDGPAPGEVAAELARLDALAARYRAELLAGRVLPNSVEAVRVELTYHSNALEGSTLSLRDTQLVVEGREPNTGKSLREIYEARNHDRALRLVEEWAERRPADALTQEDLLAVHAEILTGVEQQPYVYPGPLRAWRIPFVKTGTRPPHPSRIAELLPAVLDLANRPGMHPAVQATELLRNLVAVHPLAVMNGCTARLMMNHHLLRHGYPHAVILVGRRAEYLAALEAANTGHWQSFAALVLGCAANSALRLLGDD